MFLLINASSSIYAPVKIKMDLILVFGGCSISTMIFFDLIIRFFLINFTKNICRIELDTIESFDRIKYSYNYEVVKRLGAKTIDTNYKVTVRT